MLVSGGLALYRQQEALAFASDDTERKGWSGILKARLERAEGNASCNHQVVSQCVDTDNPAMVSFSKAWLGQLQEGVGWGAGWEGESAGLHDLERSLPDLGHRPMVWTAESS